MKCPGLDKFLWKAALGGLADYLACNMDFDDCVTGFGDVPCWIMRSGIQSLTDRTAENRPLGLTI